VRWANSIEWLIEWALKKKSYLTKMRTGQGGCRLVRMADGAV
jgi:hypothetical protein